MDLPAIKLDIEIPVFPLPNCVLFPGAVQPLHIFEPRYRQMMAEVIAGQGAMAMALLKPGWEKGYYGSPAIYSQVCVGRVIAHELLPDQKYNLLLQGVSRVEVVSEARREGDWGFYRVAMLKRLSESDATPSQEALQRKVLKELFEKSSLRDLTVTPALGSLFEEGVSLSRMIDGLAFALVQDCQAKQRLLEEREVVLRGELLLRELIALAGRLGPAAPVVVAGKKWPPNPGVN